MDRRINKIVTAAIAAVTLTGMFTGCGSTKTASDGKVKLTCWSNNFLNAYVDSYNDVACFKLMQEKNNVDVKFIHPVAGQESEQFTVLLASGDYPDLINYNNWQNYKGGMVKAIKDGVIIDLSPYINEEKMPNLMRWLKENPDYEKAMRNYDGSISLFPSIKQSRKINAFIGPTLRKDWLDKLGLDVPETIDDWYNVLKAFKTQDPNGNGEADEVPLVSEGINSPYHYFSAAWGAGTLMLLNEDGKAAYGPIQPGFKDFLETMHKWYSEGLFDKDFSAVNRQTLDYKMTSDTAGAYIGYTGSQMGNYLAARKGSDFDLVAAPWPKKDKDSKPYCGFDGMIQTVVPTNGIAITTHNKNIDKTIEMIDWMYGDGTIAINYGIEGESYTVENGEYKYKDEILNNPEGKDAVAALAPYALPNWGVGGSVILDDAYNKIARAYDQQKYAAQIWSEGDTSICLPALTFTEEENEAISNVKADINTYVMEYMTKVIIGTESVDSFDSYVQTIKGMGVDKMIEAYQKAYDRYLGN